MVDYEFYPKIFYRKFDALISRIGGISYSGNLLFNVLDELVGSFSDELKIKSGSIYRLKYGSYNLVKGPVGEDDSKWPESIPVTDPVFAELSKHKSYIYIEAASPPWGNNSIATMIGERDESIIIFRLKNGWTRETLQFSMNTIRSTLNLSSSKIRFNADIQEAYEIQMSLLPETDPVFEGYDISGRSVPAERVGGDLYDFNLLDEEVLSFAIGDASGHGLPAALLARDVVTGLRMGIENEMKISGVIRKLNHVIHQSRLSTRFVSLVYGELDRNGTLVYINAGHPPPVLFKKDDVNLLDVGGTILGPIKESIFKRGFAFMEPEDTLVMFTDGIIETSDGKDDIYGTDRLFGLVRNMRPLPAKDIVEGIFDDVVEFSSGDKPADDASVVVINRLS